MKIHKLAGVLLCAICGAIISLSANAESTMLSLSHQSGTYNGTQMVHLSAPYEADIYYTTDSTIPTKNSLPYDGKPVIVSENTTIFAAAFVDGEAVCYSGATLSIRTSAPVVSHKSGVYEDSFVVTVTCPDDSARIFYTTDGTTPTMESKEYTRPLSISRDYTLRFAAFSDNKEQSAVVTRNYKIGNNVYDEPTRQQLFELVNNTRAQYGLSPLEEMNTLSDIAQLRAKECSSYFSHWRPDGTKWDSLLAAEGLKRDMRAENIAYYSSTAKAVMDSWMSSYYHRANILDPDAKYIGIGHYDGYYCDYWAQIFIGEE